MLISIKNILIKIYKLDIELMLMFLSSDKLSLCIIFIGRIMSK